MPPFNKKRTPPAAVANPAHLTGEPIIVNLTTTDEPTDRANRYRANDVMHQLPASTRTRCHFCGQPPRLVPLMPGHIDGDEDHNDAANISPTCRSCNNTIAHNFILCGIGRRTRQFNPMHAIRSAEEYVATIATLKSARRPEAIETAIARLQATPHEDRDRLAAAIRSQK